MTAGPETTSPTCDITADLAAIRCLGPWTAELILGEAPDAEPRALHGVELAVQELAANIVRHALRPDESAHPAPTDLSESASATNQDRSFRVTFLKDAGTIGFVFDDDGAPFEQTGPTSMPDHRSVGGRGLGLIAQLTDEWSHARVNGRNVWTLTFLRARFEPR